MREDDHCILLLSGSCNLSVALGPDRFGCRYCSLQRIQHTLTALMGGSERDLQLGKVRIKAWFPSLNC